MRDERKRGRGPSGCLACKYFTDAKYWASTKGILNHARGELAAATRRMELAA